MVLEPIPADYECKTGDTFRQDANSSQGQPFTLMGHLD